VRLGVVAEEGSEEERDKVPPRQPAQEDVYMVGVRADGVRPEPLGLLDGEPFGGGVFDLLA
jgi:hypothetical protein